MREMYYLYDITILNDIKQVMYEDQKSTYLAKLPDQDQWLVFMVDTLQGEVRLSKIE